MSTFLIKFRLGGLCVLSKNLKYLRNKSGLSISDLSQKLGMSSLTVQWWEDDRTNPDSKQILLLANFFSVSVDDLLTTDIEKESSKSESKFKQNQRNKSEKSAGGNRSSIVSLIIIGFVIFLGMAAVFFIWSSPRHIVIESESIQDEKVVEDVGEPILNYMNMISAGRNFSVFMSENGELTGYGENEYKQLNFSNWNEIDAISAGGFHTLGLKNDGTVLATGYNEYGQLKVETWSNIEQISAGRYHSLGLKFDGTVVCAGGEKKYTQCDVSTWQNIIQVSAGRYNSYGLRDNGTVVSTSDNGYGQANIAGWNDVVQVSAGTYHVLGLKRDGTVLCAGGQKSDGVCNIDSWDNIIQVVGAGYHSIGLKSDGTVIAVGNNDKGQLNVQDWKDVVAISGGRYHTIGLTKDFKFLSKGLDYNQASSTTPNQGSTSTIVEKDNGSTSETTSQKNAIKLAENYLRFTSFSREGLIKQLQFEGFSNEDATYAVDNIVVDWNNQALLKAKEYLDYSHFSRDGLIRQLEFEGFTYEEAVHGVESVGL